MDFLDWLIPGEVDQPAETPAGEFGTTLKHHPGGKDHNQRRHGWRFAKGGSDAARLGAARRSLRNMDAGERAEYRKRAGMQTPTKIVKPKRDPDKVTDELRANYKKAQHTDYKNLPTIQNEIDYQQANNAYPHDSDSMLKSIMHDQGFDGPAAVVSKGQMDRLVRDGEVFEVHRGMTGGWGGGDAAKFVEQYRTGDFFAGSGIYGNGVYSSPHRSVAKVYAGDNESGMIRLGIRKDAKIGKYSDIKADMMKDQTRRRNQINARIRKINDIFNNTSPSLQQWNKLRAELVSLRTEISQLRKNTQSHPAMGDVGRYAASKGYDAYQVDDGSTDHWVILNRTATYAER